jgi:hypothetical protein
VASVDGGQRRHLDGRRGASVDGGAVTLGSGRRGRRSGGLDGWQPEEVPVVVARAGRRWCTSREATT